MQRALPTPTPTLSPSHTPSGRRLPRAPHAPPPPLLPYHRPTCTSATSAPPWRSSSARCWALTPSRAQRDWSPPPRRWRCAGGGGDGERGRERVGDVHAGVRACVHARLGNSPPHTHTHAHTQEELSSAAADFQQYGQEFDAARLREQVVETLKVRAPESVWACVVWESLWPWPHTLNERPPPLLLLLCRAGQQGHGLAGSKLQGQQRAPRQQRVRSEWPGAARCSGATRVWHSLIAHARGGVLFPSAPPSRPAEKPQHLQPRCTVPLV